MKKKCVAQYLDEKPMRQVFHGEAPIELLRALDKVRSDIKARSRNQVMLAAFRLLVETHGKKTE
jgi:hypothetical protein